MRRKKYISLINPFEKQEIQANIPPTVISEMQEKVWNFNNNGEDAFSILNKKENNIIDKNKNGSFFTGIRNNKSGHTR